MDSYRMNIDIQEFNDDDTLQGPYLVGMETAKRIFIGSVIESDNQNILAEPEMSESYLLAGVCGSGKTFIEYKFRIQAILKGGYTVFNIPLAEKMAEDKENMISFLNEIRSEMIRRNKNAPDEKIFFSFGDIDLILDDSSLMYYFAMTVIRLKAVSNYYIFTACCGCEASAVPLELRNAFTIIDIPQPNSEERRKFFIYNYLEQSGADADLFVQITDGFTYGELSVLCKKIMHWCRGCYRADHILPEQFVDENGYKVIYMGKYMNDDVLKSFIHDIENARFIEKVSSMSTVPIPTQLVSIPSYPQEENKNIAGDYGKMSVADINYDHASDVIEPIDDDILYGEKPVF